MRKGMLLGLAAALTLGVGGASAQELPPPAEKTVDFKADIWPIFESKCLECHGAEKKKSGLRMHTKADAMTGGTEGPMLVAGKSAESLIVQLMAGTNENFDRMPPEGDPLTPEQIGLVRAWIDQGANWPDDFATPPSAGAPAPTPEGTPAPEAPPAPEKTAAELAESAAAVGMAEHFKVEATKQDGALATWGVVPGQTGPDGGIVFGVTAVNHESAGTFNLMWTDKVPFQNGSIQVMMKSVSGEEDQGGGLMWRVKDKDNYYVARYNPLEGNLRVYKVVNGEREQLATADCKPEKEWLPLLIEANGPKYKAVLDGSVTLEGEDATFPDTGGAGFWTKADAITHFNGVEITM